MFPRNATMDQPSPPRIRGFALVAMAACLLLATLTAAAEDRTSYFRTIVVEPGDIADDVICFFCPVRVRGTVDGDVVTFFAGVEVEGEVKGDLVVIGGAVHVRPTGKIEGDTVALPGPILEEQGSSFGGETDEHPWCHLPGQRQVFWRGAVGWLAHLLGGAFLILLCTGARRVYYQAEYISLHPLRTLLTGAVLFAGIFGLYYLTERMNQYAGWWAIGVTVLWGLLFLLGLGGACAWLARAFLSTMNMLWLTLAGAVLVALLSFIPFAGLVLFVLVMFAAMGLPLWTRFQTQS